MAIAWPTIQRQIAARVNALSGSTATVAETSYTTASSSVYDSARFNYTLIVDAALAAQAQICQVIADTKSHPYRRIMADTVMVANDALIPVVGTGSASIIGQYGEVRATVSGVTCLMSPVSMADMARWQRRGSGNYTNNLFNYCIGENGRLYATQTPCIIEVCTYDRTAQATNLGSGGNILLPDALEDLLVAGAVAYLVKDTEYMDQGSYYERFFQDGLNQLRNGATSLFAPMARIPADSTVK